MDSVFVQDQTALHDLCQRLQDSSWVAIDTEFMRERTYYARLCLIQIATPNVVACIDPLAVDIGSLLDLIYSPTRLKVFHAARQDLEVFHDVRGNPPQPVFDTQIAAALLGFEDQIGYGALVQAVTEVKLEKQHTRTDWCVRPLTSQQLRYAEDDVVYLCEVYLNLSRRLTALGRYAWLEEECAALADPARFHNEAEQAYKRIRQGYQLPVAAQSVLKALAAWRERTAQTRDLPRNWIAPDSILEHIALEEISLPWKQAAKHMMLYGYTVVEDSLDGEIMSQRRDKPTRKRSETDQEYTTRLRIWENKRMSLG